MIAGTFAGYYSAPNGAADVKHMSGHLHCRMRKEIHTMLSKRIKENTLKNTRRHDSDTGSPEAQVALLTRQIEELSTHLRKHKKDFHSRRGLLQMVADRRTHLKYLQKKDEKAYEALIKKLGLKR